MQDNNCDDPHADLVMSKKALSLFQEDEDHGQRKTKRKVAVDKLNSYKPSKRGMCPVSNVLILCKLWDVMSLPYLSGSHNGVLQAEVPKEPCAAFGRGSRGAGGSGVLNRRNERNKV